MAVATSTVATLSPVRPTWPRATFHYVLARAPGRGRRAMHARLVSVRVVVLSTVCSGAPAVGRIPASRGRAGVAVLAGNVCCCLVGARSTEVGRLSRGSGQVRFIQHVIQRSARTTVVER